MLPFTAASRFISALLADNARTVRAIYDNAIYGEGADDGSRCARANLPARARALYANSSAEIFISRMFVTARTLSE